MRKSFNSNQQPLPVIPPPEIEPEPEIPTPITNDEMFGDKPKVSLEVSAKRGVGKRGKDKKPRVKKPLSEKQLAHLKRIRGLALEKRQKNKAKKDVIRKKAKEDIEQLKKVKFVEPLEEKVEENIEEKEVEEIEEEPVNTIIASQGKVRTPMVEEVVRKTKPIPVPIKKVDDYQHFFNLMDKYEKHKELRNLKVEKTLQQRLDEKRMKKTDKSLTLTNENPPSQPHPNKKIANHLRPVAPLIPPNPYAVCFGYNNKW